MDRSTDNFSWSILQSNKLGCRFRVHWFSGIIYQCLLSYRGGDNKNKHLDLNRIISTRDMHKASKNILSRIDRVNCKEIFICTSHWSDVNPLYLISVASKVNRGGKRIY